MKSQFDKWFEAQHGPRIRSGVASRRIGDAQLNALRNGCAANLAEYEAELAYRRSWDERYQAASYAKNAAPGFEF